ncbi:MAG: YceI family protein [Mariniphaga sp.]|nr:YceI family protein [Mariniphaga sp.]
MIKYLIVAGFLFSLNNLHAQILTFDHGKIEFYTKTIVSDIEAITEKVFVKLDVQNRNIETTIDIKSFEFEDDLMQEHFNEKYLESDRFPKATFQGKILQDISNIIEEIEAGVSGSLTIHGVTKEIEVKVQISKKEDFTYIKSLLSGKTN